jgi:hypothetical protein
MFYPFRPSRRRLPCSKRRSIQVRGLVGCFELHSIEGSPPFEKAWPAVDQLISSISTLMLTRQGCFSRYHYFLDVLDLVLSLCGITFIAGPQVQPTRSPFVTNPSRCLPFISCIPFLSPVGFRIHPRSPIKTAAVNCSRLRVYLPFSLSRLYRLSNVLSTTHRMLSHLALALTHSWTSYKLERRSSKLYKRTTTVG